MVRNQIKTRATRGVPVRVRIPRFARAALSTSGPHSNESEKRAEQCSCPWGLCSGVGRDSDQEQSESLAYLVHINFGVCLNATRKENEKLAMNG